MSEIADFGQLKDFTPYQGDGSAVLLAFDGDVHATLKKISKGESGSGNKTIKLVMNVTEPDGTGGVLYKDIPYTGTRSDQKSNMVGVAEFLLSAGWTFEEIQALAAGNAQVNIDKLITDVLAKGRDVYVTVSASMYKGKESSSVDSFITKARYEENVSAGTARRPRAGATSVSSNGASRAAAAPAGGADPLANLM